MHELSVCQALLRQVAEIAHAQQAAVVERITIEMGPLCGSEPALLLSAFAVMRSGVASSATLWIKHSAVTIRCLQCEAHTETRPNRLICGACGGWRTRIIAGDELRLLKVEMRLPNQAMDPAAGVTAEQSSYV